MKIKILKSRNNWYKVGEIYTVRNINDYKEIGLQVLRDDDTRPWVVMHGDYEYVGDTICST